MFVGDCRTLPVAYLGDPRADNRKLFILMYFVDLAGTFIFAISGGLVAVRHKLDALGILVLAVATGVGGGLIRDVVLGATPPASFQDEWYLLVCLIGGMSVFLLAGYISSAWKLVRIADAMGLGVFAAAGAAKAAGAGLGPIGITMMAAITATGGGVIRDVLVVQIPAVLQRDFYATATIIGGATFALGVYLNAPLWLTTSITIFITTGLRLLAMWRGLRLPKARS